MIGKFGFLCFGAVFVGSAFAIPSSSEIKKVKADVDAIIKDVDLREKGDWDKAGDAILSLGGEATDEAERFLLSGEAALRYLRSGHAGKAKDVLSWFVDKDDSASALAIDERVRRRLTFKEQKALKTTPSFAEYEAFVNSVAREHREKVASASRLSDLESKYATDKENARTRNLLAREYALRGDWAKAIPLLSKAKGNIGLAAREELAKPEATGNDAVAIADGWWKVEGREYAKELTDACRLHAAEWYRKVIADESLSGLVRARIGGRIDEVESSVEKVFGHAKNPNDSDIKGFPRVSVKGGERIKCLLNAKDRVFVELTTCAPGEFEMGEGEEACNRRHKVKLSYPYLITCGHVTYGMVKAVNRKGWKALFDNLKPNEAKFYDDDRAVEGLTADEMTLFLEKLNVQAARCSDLRPYRGYEFRLPTEAEWFCAYLAGGNADMEGITDAELKAYWGKLGNAEWKSLPPEEEIRKMSEKKSNAWGVFNMVRGKEEIVDTIPLPKDKKGMRAFWLPDAVDDCFKYADSEENPYRLCKGRNACHILRKGRSSKGARPLLKTDLKGNVTGGQNRCCIFRLVYGPKLDKLNVYPKQGDEKRK